MERPAIDKQVAKHPITLKLASLSTLVAIWFIFTRKAFAREFSFAIWLDNEEYFSPIMSRMSNLFSLHQWPFWFENFLGGVKYYDNPQLTPYYPFYFLYIDRFNSPQQAMQTVHIVTLFHLLIFLLTSYYLLRVLGISRLISIACATLIVFNQNTYQLCTWLTIISTLSWTPLAIAGVFLIIKNGDRRSFIVFCTATWLIMVASPSQNFIFTLFLSALFFMFLIYQIPRDSRWETFTRISKQGLKPVIVLIALSVPIYLPILLGWSGYIRWVGNFPPVIGFQKIPFSAFLDEQLNRSELPNLILKKPPIHPNGDIYVGALILIIVLIGSFLLWRVKTYRFFMIIAVYSLVSSFGSNFGLAQFNYEIPGINLIRQPGRFLTIFHLSLYICLAYVLDQVRILHVKRSTSETNQNASSRKFLKNVNNNMFGLLIGTLVVVNQFVSVPLRPPIVENSDYKTQRIQLLETVFQRIVTLDPKSEFRVAFVGKADPQRSSMFASYYGIRSVTAYFNPAPLDQFQNMYFYDLLPASYMNDLGLK